MEINVIINDTDLEARVRKFYQANKLGDESLNTFGGRVILGQMVAKELSAALQVQQEKITSDLQNTQRAIVESGEETIKTWAKDAELKAI